jgi:hypothetical protein
MTLFNLHARQKGTQGMRVNIGKDDCRMGTRSGNHPEMGLAFGSLRFSASAWHEPISAGVFVLADTNQAG